MDERMEITKGTHRAIPKTRKVASHATQEKLHNCRRISEPRPASHRSADDSLRVEEKQGDWDAETKTNAQKTNADGVPQWLIQTLFQPIDGDTEHAPEVVPVTVTAKVKPVIRVGVPVEFVGFGAWVYVSHDKTTKQVTSVGRSFMAAGFKQNGGE